MRRVIATMLTAAMMTPVMADAQRRSYEGRAEARAPGPREGGGENRERGFRGDAGPRPERIAPRPIEERRDDRPDVDRYRGMTRDGRDGTPRLDTPLPPANRPDLSGGDRDWRGGGARFDGRADVRRLPDGDRRSSGRSLMDGRTDQDRRYGDADRRDDRGWNGGNARRWNDSRGWNNRRTWNDGRSWNDARGWNRNGGSDRRRWDRDWRADDRYDWSRYRGANRSAFHLPRYYAPYDWTGGYRRFGIGASLSVGLWDRSYWIGDPWAYRLPEAWGSYRWVRYYDDALLVDLETGDVVDAVYGIFW